MEVVNKIVYYILLHFKITHPRVGVRILRNGKVPLVESAHVKFSDRSMNRHRRQLSQKQRDKTLEERRQAIFRESYLDPVVEAAHIGIRNFVNVCICICINTTSDTNPVIEFELKLHCTAHLVWPTAQEAQARQSRVDSRVPAPEA